MSSKTQKRVQRTHGHLIKKDRITPDSVLTKYGKGTENARAISFSLSASEFCDDSCGAYNNGCYAQAIERLYSSLSAKLLRHSRHLFTTLRAATLAIGKVKTLDFFRISVDGSVPYPENFASAKQWQQWRKAFRVFLVTVADRAPVHFPVESVRKARLYRRILQGTGIVVRRSCQSERSGLQSRDVRAVRVGISSNPRHHEVNKRLASEYAAKVRATGQTCVVCPAVIGDSKCGQCTACPNAAVDVVVYPLHS